MSRFDWDDLRFFLAVARSQTVSNASRTLGVDHATVIRRLDSLERSLNVKLFQRNPRGYNLTQTGERLLGSAQAIETEALKASATAGGADPSISGTLRISSLEGIGNFFLAKRLPRFAADHRDLKIELIAIQQLVALSRREADIAITLQPPGQGRFISERLTDYTLFVYGARSYLRRAPEIRSRQDLRDHPFVGYIDDLVFVRGLDYLDDIGYRLRPFIQSSSLLAQMEIVRAGHGLCVLPHFMAAQHKDLVAVRPKEIFLRRSYWLVGHADAAGSARVRAAMRFIQTEAAAAQDLFMGPPGESSSV